MLKISQKKKKFKLEGLWDFMIFELTSSLLHVFLLVISGGSEISLGWALASLARKLASDLDEFDGGIFRKLRLSSNTRSTSCP